MSKELEIKTKQLVDELKKVCADAGLGNDGNEYKIITEVFLYKFMNDMFFYRVRELDKKYKVMTARELEDALKAMSSDDYGLLLAELSGIAKLKPEQFLSNLYNSQNKEQFAKYFDDTLKGVATDNASIFNVGASDGSKIQLFSGISQYITEEGAKDGFCRAITNKLFDCNFGDIFQEKYDFFAAIFEYLIKDYNKDGGGKYAEYYTPRAVAKIMSEILVQGDVSNVQCYDPSAGTGSLLMSLAHKIGEDRCTIYSQDISQKSSTLLRMNLILNSLAHSLPNVIKGNTLTDPYHLQRGIAFDYIVSNPPFKLDFSDWRDSVDADKDTFRDDGKNSFKKRFFAGVPNVPNKDKDKMAIYLLFIQHIIASLKIDGKAAVVVPTGFLTEGKGKENNIANKIRMKLIDSGWLRAVVSMPSNIFATTGTNVSVLFIDKGNTSGRAVLVDASGLGTTIKEGKNQKTLLSPEEERRIINAVLNLTTDNGFSVVKTFTELKDYGKYSFNPGTYFEVNIEREDITETEFVEQVTAISNRLDVLFARDAELKAEIKNGLIRLKYDKD